MFSRVLMTFGDEDLHDPESPLPLSDIISVAAILKVGHRSCAAAENRLAHCLHGVQLASRHHENDGCPRSGSRCHRGRTV